MPGDCDVCPELRLKDYSSRLNAIDKLPAILFLIIKIAKKISLIQERFFVYGKKRSNQCTNKNIYRVYY